MGKDSGGGGRWRRMEFLTGALPGADATRLHNTPEGTMIVRPSCCGAPLDGACAGAEWVAPALPMRSLIGLDVQRRGRQEAPIGATVLSGTPSRGGKTKQRVDRRRPGGPPPLPDRRHAITDQRSSAVAAAPARPGQCPAAPSCVTPRTRRPRSA